MMECDDDSTRVNTVTLFWSSLLKCLEPALMDDNIPF